jgi:hypothetical protein
MANNIALSTTYVPMLDEVYKLSSLSAVLDANTDLVSLAAGSKEFKIPKMSLDGLANHSRGGEYVNGDVTLAWETKAPDYDRNRMFTVDIMDNEESQGIAFGRLAGEFVRTKVVPEIDSVRFSKYHSAAAVKATGTLASAEDFLAALIAAYTSMEEKEVPMETVWLFATPSLLNSVMALQTIESREILARFQNRIVSVPKTRFNTEVTLATGGAGQTAGGFTLTGEDINFLLISPTAVIQTLKHVSPKIVSPEDNQSGDNWKFGYRVYGIATFLDNKVDAIYSHAKAAE